MTTEELLIETDQALATLLSLHHTLRNLSAYLPGEPTLLTERDELFLKNIIERCGPAVIEPVIRHVIVNATIRLNEELDRD